MRIALNVVGWLCLLVGCVWILQGINVLPGSFMTGQTKWAVYGALVLVAGIGMLIAANRHGTVSAATSSRECARRLSHDPKRPS